MGVAGLLEVWLLRADAVDVDVGELADVERGGAGNVVDVDGGVRLLWVLLQ